MSRKLTLSPKTYAKSPKGYFVQRNIERRSLIATWKLERGCADCGYDADPVALEFDHLPGAEKVNKVSAMVNMRLDTLIEEMEKCDVVCSNCHRIRTWNRQDV